MHFAEKLVEKTGGKFQVEQSVKTGKARVLLSSSKKIWANFFKVIFSFEPVYLAWR